MIDEKLIELCKQNNRKAQRKVYEQLSGKLYYTCKRYLSREDEIQDILVDSFHTIFSKIHQLKENKAIEGWARQIAVNKCLYALRKNVNFNLHLQEELLTDQLIELPDTQLEHEDLLNLVNQLPASSKAVFNLFVVEGYSHKEIAEQLNISQGTSKSQLSFAKKKLQSLVQNFFYLKSDAK